MPQKTKVLKVRMYMGIIPIREDMRENIASVASKIRDMLGKPGLNIGESIVALTLVLEDAICAYIESCYRRSGDIDACTSQIANDLGYVLSNIISDAKRLVLKHLGSGAEAM